MSLQNLPQTLVSPRGRPFEADFIFFYRVIGREAEGVSSRIRRRRQAIRMALAAESERVRNGVRER